MEEGDLLFGVNLSDYLDTGLFLDQRIHRARIRELAEGKSVLNLFAYTGSFSVAAAAGGAEHVTTVDMSATYLAWAEDNFELNEQDPDVHECIQSDVFGFLRDAVEDGLAFDLIVCDPPTFSNSKRMIGTLDIQRDHTGLLNLAAKLLRPGGHMFFSTNRRKFRLSEDELDLVVEEKWTPQGIRRTSGIGMCIKLGGCPLEGGIEAISRRRPAPHSGSRRSPRKVRMHRAPNSHCNPTWGRSPIGSYPVPNSGHSPTPECSESRRGLRWRFHCSLRNFLRADMHPGFHPITILFRPVLNLAGIQKLIAIAVGPFLQEVAGVWDAISIAIRGCPVLGLTRIDNLIPIAV